VRQAQRLARRQHGQAAVRQEPGPRIVADPAGTFEPPMGREINLNSAVGVGSGGRSD
jgi:hypothetical protein